MKLHELHDNEGANRKKKRIGRGPGSGKGKTGGRGIKGQKSRSGVAISGYEGGQMPLYQRLPKRGFKSVNKKKFIATINLKTIQKILDKKNILTNKKVDLSILKKTKVIGKKYEKIKLLGDGDIKEKLDIEVNFISNSAKNKIEKLGGKVSLIKT